MNLPRKMNTLLKADRFICLKFYYIFAIISTTLAGADSASTSTKQKLSDYDYGTSLAGNYIEDFIPTTSIITVLLIPLTIIQFLLSV